MEIKYKGLLWDILTFSKDNLADMYRQNRTELSKVSIEKEKYEI